MRPTELNAGAGQKEAPKQKLKFAVDPKADPPITGEEALAATAANCRRHRGLIGQRGDKIGAVYLCLSCGQYWRYAKYAGPSRRRLKYPARSHI
jgi:hypothetical protein